jgi:SulP family sulfate permease
MPEQRAACARLDAVLWFGLCSLKGFPMRMAQPAGDARPDPFTPALLSVLREGYGWAALRADAVAGLTVAIVALPLSMAIAIASGLGPERGLVTAIVGGFTVSALGGSRYQIGGPAGAFIVLVAACVLRHGVDGLILATLLSGLMLAACGWLRLGSFIRFIPYPVTVGFTAGIAVLILASQIVPLLGLRIEGVEPAAVVEKMPVLLAALPTLSLAALALGAGTVAVILALRRHAPRAPGMLVALILAAGLTALIGLPVETVSGRFGALPTALPWPALPPFSAGQVWAVLPEALAFTLLGAIESLLSATVADGMTGVQHRSDGELVAQGAANIASALFGGFCVTGTIARTATNVRAGGRSPVSGMLHALFLLGFMAVAAPLAGHIPLAALAGVLAVVAWGMAERHAFTALLTGPRGDAVVLLATFGLTVLRDLTEAIIVGFALGSVLFIRRMAAMTALEASTAQPRDLPGPDSDIVVYRVRGALFFGAASVLDGALDRIGAAHRVSIIDLSAAPLIDSSGAHSLARLAARSQARGVAVIIAGASAQAMAALRAQGVAAPAVAQAGTLEAALAMAQVGP